MQWPNCCSSVTSPWANKTLRVYLNWIVAVPMIKWWKAKGSHSSGAADFVLLHGRIFFINFFLCFCFIVLDGDSWGRGRNMYWLKPSKDRKLKKIVQQITVPHLLKEMVHPKMEMLTSFTHPLYVFFQSCDRSEEMLRYGHIYQCTAKCHGWNG